MKKPVHFAGMVVATLFATVVLACGDSGAASQQDVVWPREVGQSTSMRTTAPEESQLPVVAVFATAHRFFRREWYAGAETLFALGLRRDPSNADALFFLAEIKRRFAEYDDAVTLFEMAVASGLSADRLTHAKTILAQRDRWKSEVANAESSVQRRRREIDREIKRLNEQRVRIERRKPITEGHELREAQLALRRRGFKPGPADGVFGMGTYRAIKAFQRSIGLPQTGELDRDTYNRIVY